MITQQLADQTTLLDLSIEEHRALSRGLGSVLGALEPSQIERVLGFDSEFAYEFQFSVFLREAAARMGGIGWLTGGGFDDRIVMGERLQPSVDIQFDRYGARWRVTDRQLTFLETCMTFHSARSVLLR